MNMHCKYLLCSPRSATYGTNSAVASLIHWPLYVLRWFSTLISVCIWCMHVSAILLLLLFVIFSSCGSLFHLPWSLHLVLPTTFWSVMLCHSIPLSSLTIISWLPILSGIMPLVSEEKSKLAADANPPSFDLHATSFPTLCDFSTSPSLPSHSLISKTCSSSSAPANDDSSYHKSSCSNMSESSLLALHHLFGAWKQGLAVTPSSLPSTSWIPTSCLGVQDIGLYLLHKKALRSHWVRIIVEEWDYPQAIIIHITHNMFVWMIWYLPITGCWNLVTAQKFWFIKTQIWYLSLGSFQSSTWKSLEAIGAVKVFCSKWLYYLCPVSWWVVKVTSVLKVNILAVWLSPSDLFSYRA